MAAAWPDLDEKDLNRAKNKKASDEVIPFVYKTVIAWGCPKNKDESFLAYYNRRPEKLWEENKKEWEKEVEKKFKEQDMTERPEVRRKDETEITEQLKNDKTKKLLIKVTWTQEELQHLNQKACDGFDVPLLHKLVPTICDGIGRCDPNAPSNTMIEQFLREVKNLRNYIYHDPKGASDTILDDLEVFAVNVFKAAGDLYAPLPDQPTVQDKIDELKERLQKIKTEEMTGEQQRILQTAKKISGDGMAEMHAAVMKLDIDFLPLSDDKVKRIDVFHSVDLLITSYNEEDNKDAGTENRYEKTISEIPSLLLLEHFEGSHVLCEGQPGSGKTTLLKTLREDFGAKTKERFRGVRKFDLLMYMECRNNSVTTVEQLLEHQFPKTFQQIRKEEAVNALRELKLLICVDGLDELTSHTKELLRELSKFANSGNATFIFTSRPGQAHQVSLNHETVTLQSLKGEDQQEEFLLRYHASIEGFSGPGLIAAFKSLNETGKAVLRQPANLALFCALFQKSPQVVKKLENDATFLNDLLGLSKQTMIDRMDTMDLANSECYAEDVTTLILNLSVCLLQKQEMTFTANTFRKMCQCIFLNAPVVYYANVSTFFTKLPDQQTFEFYHKSHTEFFAAKAIAQRFVSSSTVGVVGTIKAICREQSHYFPDGAADGEDISLQRFENVLRFVCMLLHEGGLPMKGALQSFLDEVCLALAAEGVGLEYWTNFVLGCPDSDQVARAAAKAAHTVSGEGWTVQSSRAMTATSKMLPYFQLAWLGIKPLRDEEYPGALAVLLAAVTLWHTGLLRLVLSESHDNYSACDDSLASLESARCGLYYFKGCLSGRSSRAWNALIGGVERAQEAGREQWLFISLLNPMLHKLGQLYKTRHNLYITALPPSNPGDLRPCPLPTSLDSPPDLRVECRPIAGNEGATAELIHHLAPGDKNYDNLSLLHYTGPDDALDGMVDTLRARGVRTENTSSRGWEEAGRFGCCKACEDSSGHRGRERCVILSFEEESREEERGFAARWPWRSAVAESPPLPVRCFDDQEW